MFTKYTGNRQFDLQLNRTFAPIFDRVGMDTIATTTLPNIRSTKQITALAHSLAERFSSEGDADAAWRLYELAAFYLGADDPRKRSFIDAMSTSFDEAHRGLALTRHAVPYRGGELTAMRWEADPTDRAQAPEGTPRTLIMMNGFDGYAEEIIDFASHFPTRPFDIISFDGPGQGHTVLAGMPLEPQWERPTNAVMDYFGVQSAAALGVSFGGYLVTRAAAYCPRISHVIAFDMMYRLLDGLTLPLPRPPASHRGRGRPEPETRMVHRCRAARRAEVQRRPSVEAAAGFAPDGSAQAERGAASIWRLHDGTSRGTYHPAVPGPGRGRRPVRAL